MRKEQEVNHLPSFEEACEGRRERHTLMEETGLKFSPMLIASIRGRGEGKGSL